jgi:hypothetical protein
MSRTATSWPGYQEKADVGSQDAKGKTADLSTALRSGRDDKFVAGRDSAFPEEVRRTADPSASLGMTKGRVVVTWKSGRWPESVFHLGLRAFAATNLSSRPAESWAWGPTKVMKNASSPATTFQVTTTLPFVIPSEAEGSAVLRTSPGNAESRPATNLSSRPERSAVERSAVSLFRPMRTESNG